MADIDLLPFVETSDGTPSFPISQASLCLVTAFSWHFLYTKSMELFPEKKKAARIAPLIHAFWATFCSIYVIYNYSPIFIVPSTICSILGPTQYIFTVSLGYFLWDLFICFRENWGLDWKIHAIFCVAMYGIATVQHSMHRWGIMVLFYEFSTIFLHCYIFLYYYGYKSFGDRMKIVFGLSFFFCRLVVGSFVTKECIQAYLGWRDIDFSCVGLKTFTFVIIVNLLFHVLNLHWFWLIVRAAIWGKPQRKSSKSHRKKKSSSTKTKVSSSTVSSNGYNKSSSSASTDPNKHKNGTSKEKINGMNK